MTVKEAVLQEIKLKSGLTEHEIAVNIYGRRHAYQQRVNKACRELFAQGSIVRRGEGGWPDTFTYHLPPMRR